MILHLYVPPQVPHFAPEFRAIEWPESEAGRRFAWGGQPVTRKVV